MAEITIDQFAESLKKLAKDIQGNGIKIAEKMALTGKSLVQERIQKEGFGATYSKKMVPAYFLHGKELRTGSKASKKFFETNNLDDDLVNWSEFRQAQGLQTEFVDLTYSGRMFGGIRPINKGGDGKRFFVHLGGTDREVDLKLGWNTQRYGDFMRPNEAEQKEVDEIVEDEFQKLIKRHFG